MGGFEQPQIFISSTSELTPERRAVSKAIRGMTPPCRPFDYLVHTARRASPKDECERQIRNSNVFLLLLGAAYGSLFPGQPMSIVEWEYELAKKHRSADLQTYRKQFPPGSGVLIDNRQEAFIRRVCDFEQGHWSVMFATPEELCDTVVNGIEAWREECKSNYELLEPVRGPWRDRLFTIAAAGISLFTVGATAWLAVRGTAQGTLLIVAGTGLLCMFSLVFFRNLKL
ncbi:MAG TPA: DUF4062 domain-containing protein [Thermoanaerobaculia bacterium]|jgi:hypothetical protein|nr:DUF4062 domain-containing protein [Thermoanaerobaculia bacterium]